MNAALRASLKATIDAHTRALVLPPDDHPGFCSECRMPHDTETPDCRTCRDRHRARDPQERAKQSEWHKRKLATDTVYREKRRRLNNSRKRAQRARARDAA